MNGNAVVDDDDDECIALRAQKYKKIKNKLEQNKKPEEQYRWLGNH